MKLRYYLRGLGIGLIVTTLVLTISNNLRNTAKANENSQKETAGSVLAYTTQQATENKANATTESASSEQESTSLQDDQKSESSAEDETTEADTKSAAETTTEAVTEKSTEKVTEKKTENNQNNSDSVTVSIKNVYYSSIAADILYDAGVIDDKKEFNSYMYSSGYATKIKEGEYSLKKGDSFENIAKTITKTK